MLYLHNHLFMPFFIKTYSKKHNHTFAFLFSPPCKLTEIKRFRCILTVHYQYVKDNCFNIFGNVVPK